MSRGARVFWWAVVVAAVGVPYVRQVIRATPAEPLPDWVPERLHVPEPLPTLALIAIPFALVGAGLLLRRREARVLQFRRPDARAADVSLVALAMMVAVPRALALLGGLPAGWGGIVVDGVVLAITLAAWRALGRRGLEEAWGLGFGERPRQELYVGVLGFTWALPLSVLFVHVALQSTGGNLQPIWRAFRVVILAPVVEEVFCRGALYTALRRSESWLAASGVVAVIFAALHGYRGNLWWSAGFFAHGFLLCAIREWRGTLLGCVISHSLFNATITLVIIGHRLAA